MFILFDFKKLNMPSSIPCLKSLENILFNEKKCIDFLFEKDILYKPQTCSYCEDESPLYREGKLFRCINRQCRKSVSIFKNSFFAKDHLKCSDTMLIGYYWLCKINYTSIRHMTGHSSNTITNYMNFFRELVISTLEDDNNMIGGEGIIVEIDESKFCRRKYHRGCVIQGVWIVGGIERTNEKRCFLEVVEDRTAETLHDLISRHVAPGSIVHTDLWRGYIGIERLNMIHRTVNHSENFIDPNTGAHTNTIEGLWNGIKIGISPRNRNKNTIMNHLLEFIWRKKNHNNLWTSFLNALKTTEYFN
jgi:transposase-like protein